MRGHRHGRSRDTGFYFTARFNEAAVEKLLEQARARGVVTEFDTGRGRIVWFNGCPGPALRAVRDAVRAHFEEAPCRCRRAGPRGGIPYHRCAWCRGAGYVASNSPHVRPGGWRALGGEPEQSEGGVSSRPWRRR